MTEFAPSRLLSANSVFPFTPFCPVERLPGDRAKRTNAATATVAAVADVSATGLMCMHEKDIIGNYFACCTWPCDPWPTQLAVH